MVDDRQLSSVLSEFAFTLATDFSITSILDHLVRRIVGVLPITSAGVTLIEPEESPRDVAASDESALRFVKLQTKLGEGPCLLAYESGEAVSIPDLALEDRFPDFTPAALDAGMAAVFTFPLNHGSRRLGALDLYRDTPGVLNDDAMEAAQTLADVAAAYVLNARSREEAHVTSGQMRHVATHDPLTGLPNRLLLLERIGHAAQRAERSRAPAAVLFVDLDHFKRVNDTYGHQVGDELLRAVAARLIQVVRPGDTLARIYGDEFVLLCEELHDHDDVDVLVDRVQLAFVEPFRVDVADIAVTASVGVAYAGPGVRISPALITDADRAMYDSKTGGPPDKAALSPEDEPSRARSAALGRDLRAALANEGLDVAYQPIVRCHDGSIVALEALLRWEHPVDGLISAESAVTVAERTGVIGEVGAWVLDHACRDRVRWQHEHSTASFDLTVNVSTHQLMAPDFTAEVSATLERTGMPAEKLVLEVTETLLIDDPVLAQAALLDLKALGLRLALDDFGTGYSSLTYLHRLPIDIVKIDRELVTEPNRGRKGTAITAAVTRLAHAVDLAVVIEGVETRAERTAALEAGADFAQGYFFARPVAAPEIDGMLSIADTARAAIVLPLQRLPLDHDTASL